ncbi:30S ribosomal protein S2, partial [Thermogutta sp.]|uniref:30S ribosomal protein S2 n=1 Tax=Thermogutta sp. TaxID=1962930 RepID=UPI003C7E16BC
SKLVIYYHLNSQCPSNRYLIIVDPNKEKNAVREARKLGITTVALIDTDCDPDEVDLPIPGNDDSMRSIEIILRYLTDAILEGKASAISKEEPQPVASQV